MSMPVVRWSPSCFRVLVIDASPGCPHGSFQHAIIRENALPRESIEVRALVFSLPRPTDGGEGT